MEEKYKFTFIWKPSFTDTTFRLKHPVLGHVLDTTFRQIDSSSIFLNLTTLMGPMAFCRWQIFFLFCRPADLKF